VTLTKKELDAVRKSARWMLAPRGLRSTLTAAFWSGPNVARHLDRIAEEFDLTEEERISALIEAEVKFAGLAENLPKVMKAREAAEKIDQASTVWKSSEGAKDALKKGFSIASGVETLEELAEKAKQAQGMIDKTKKVAGAVRNGVRAASTAGPVAAEGVKKGAGAIVGRAATAAYVVYTLGSGGLSALSGHRFINACYRIKLAQIDGASASEADDEGVVTV